MQGGYRYNRRKTVEETLTLDLLKSPYIKQQVKDNRACSIGITWGNEQQTNKPSISVLFSPNKNNKSCFILKYTYKNAEREQVIYLTKKPLNKKYPDRYKYYLLCPYLHKPVRKLYLCTNNGYFYSREALKLTYRSTQRTKNPYTPWHKLDNYKKRLYRTRNPKTYKGKTTRRYKALIKEGEKLFIGIEKTNAYANYKTTKLLLQTNQIKQRNYKNINKVCK